MKKWILIGINYTLFTYYKVYFSTILFGLNKSVKIVFIDIDNTIADTWVTLKSNKFTNEKDRHQKLKPFDGMRTFIKNQYRDNNNSYKIIYLTARYFTVIPITKQWLNKNHFFENPDSLIVVSKPKLKLYFLKLAVKKKYDVIYIDDLSYNHENGETKFYDAIISEINTMNIDYKGYNEIKKINNVG